MITFNSMDVRYKCQYTIHDIDRKKAKDERAKKYARNKGGEVTVKSSKS